MSPVRYGVYYVDIVLLGCDWEEWNPPEDSLLTDTRNLTKTGGTCRVHLYHMVSPTHDPAGTITLKDLTHALYLQLGIHHQLQLWNKSGRQWFNMDSFGKTQLKNITEETPLHKIWPLEITPEGEMFYDQFASMFTTARKLFILDRSKVPYTLSHEVHKRLVPKKLLENAFDSDPIQSE